MTLRGPRQPVRRLAGTVALLFVLLLTGCGGSADVVEGHAEAAMEQADVQSVLAPAEPSRLRIPAIDVDTDLFVDLGLKPDNTMEVPEGAETVGWYDQSPTPGERGPSILAAHVDWQNQKGVFFELRNLDAGAEVIIDRADGTSVLFRVNEVEQYPKDAFPTDKVYGNTENAQLRLITCGGAFSNTAQSYRDNVVAYATMV